MAVIPPLSSAGNWTPAFAGERQGCKRLTMTVINVIRPNTQRLSGNRG